MKYNLSGLYIEITSKCNLNCKHCYNNSGETSINIPIDILESLISDALSDGIRSFTISGGEPFTRTDIVEIIELILKNESTRLTIVTNATLITRTLLSKVKKLVNDTSRVLFQISVDGFDQESHDFLRGKGAFDKLSSKLSLFHDFGFPIIFHTVLHSHNYQNIERILEFAAQNNVIRVDFTFLKKKGRTDLFYDKLLIAPDEEIRLINSFKLLEDSKKTIRFNYPKVFYGICPLFDSEESDIFIRIDAEGNVFPCQNFDGSDSVIGNIKERPIKEIVTETNMKDLHNRILSKRAQRSLCRDCFINKRCGKGCPGIEFCDDYSNDYSNDCLMRRKFFWEGLNRIGCQLLKGEEE